MNEEEIKLIVPRQEGQISAMFSRGGPREGAGRKAIGQTRKLSLTLSELAWAELENRCRESNQTKSEWIRELITNHFAAKTERQEGL
ncbi:hypothetical protein PV433_30405 [Paenibacillus sp. GYB004]|uniref:hypothetical protein n=1 Tax=Paenibacillus sp. GYB004 TaxID=2994393 RepID=UPI002F96B229